MVVYWGAEIITYMLKVKQLIGGKSGTDNNYFNLQYSFQDSRQ